MLSFKDFLFEDKTGTIEELAPKILKDCAPFFRAVHNKPYEVLYRGMDISGPKAEVYQRNVRKTRKPRDTDKVVQELFDGWFYREYHFRYRKAGLFCSGDWETSTIYGDTYIIYPIGPFQFLWSRHYKDLYTSSTSQGFNEAGYEPFNVNNGELIRDVYRFLEKGNWTDTDLVSAINSGHEVMLKCNRYYAIPEDEHEKFVKEMEKLQK